MNTKQLQKLDKQYVWHPFTQMKEWEEKDILMIDKGKGAYLIDTQGNSYLDGISSLWVNVHGHRKKEIDTAVKRQLDKISHSTLLGLANTPSVLLAEQLIKIAPKGLKKVFYSEAGSTSVEIAIKMAYQYYRLKGEKRNFFIKFSDSYHGDTIGSVSVGGMQLFHDIFKALLFKTFKAPWPHTYWKPEKLSTFEWRNKCLSELETILETHSKKIAAVITEPLLQGASGMATAPEGFLKATEALCRKYNVLLIVDEVATGFGRTGKMFACEWEKIRPDIMCIAKGITGGYLPLAATLTTENIYNTFCGDYKEFKTFFHGHTYTGNPLACAAALASLSVFEKEKTIQKLQNKIRLLKEFLTPLKELKHIGDIRQKGFMAGIELIKDKKKQLPYKTEEKMGIKVCRMARDKKIILRPLSNVVVLMPPFVINEKELKYLIEIVKECIIKVTEN